MKKKFNVTKVFMALVVTVSSAFSHAQMSGSAPRSDYSGFTTRFAYPVGIGISRVERVNGGASNTLHAEAEIKNDLWVGLGFGFYNSFDDLLLNGTARMNLDTKVNYALFTEAQFGWAKAVGSNSFIGGVLLGFEYSLAKQLRMSFAYGLQFGLGSAIPSKIGFTNSDFVGNFGLHWYL